MTRCKPTPTLASVLAGTVALSCLAVSARAAGPLTIAEVTVKPANPGPDAICSLDVRIKNSGTRPASALRFGVKVDGQELAVYGQQLYAVNVAPGGTTDIALYTLRAPAAPKSGAFSVEVSLIEAQWAETTVDGATTTTRWIGPVQGLPVSATLSVPVAR